MSENKIQLRKEQVQLLEKSAVMIEQKGIQPAMAKILALLMVNDEPELTFDQIWETLEISKSAASQAINQLLTLQKIEYRTKLGDRKRYFCNRVTSWQEDVKKEIESLKDFSNVLNDILNQRPENTPEFNANLKKLISFMEFMNKKLPGLYQEFEKQYQ